MKEKLQEYVIGSSALQWRARALSCIQTSRLLENLVKKISKFPKIPVFYWYYITERLKELKFCKKWLVKQATHQSLFFLYGYVTIHEMGDKESLTGSAP